jgi:hypothetical protein
LITRANVSTHHQKINDQGAVAQRLQSGNKRGFFATCRDSLAMVKLATPRRTNNNGLRVW